MYMTRSGEERFVMGVGSFDAARAIIIASPQDLPEEEFKRRLFERIYGAPIEHVLKETRDGPVNDWKRL